MFDARVQYREIEILREGRRIFESLNSNCRFSKREKNLFRLFNRISLYAQLFSMSQVLKNPQLSSSI